MNYAKLYKDDYEVPQSEPLPNKNMVKNSAGGYVFKISAEDRLMRFLILGSDSPTYYASAKKLTVDVGKVILEFSDTNPSGCANIIKSVSLSGRAPTNNNAIFALALMAEESTADARKAAFSVVNDVCRTASHFFLFNYYLQSLGRKSNRSYRTMVNKWYTEKDSGKLAYQVFKYRNRYGFSHRDLLNLAHPNPTDNAMQSIFDYVINENPKGTLDDAPDMLVAYDKALHAKSESEIVALIQQYDLTWEFIPSNWLESNDVWAELLLHMPYGAMIRNLGQLTARGIIAQGNMYAKHVAKSLENAEFLRSARVHPFNVLVAQRVYLSGKGMKGSKNWTPVHLVSDALEGAFYNSFNYVEPSEKSFFFGIDASGSTDWMISDNIPLLVCEAEAVMTMVSARVEKDYYAEAYSGGRPLGLRFSRNDSLEDATRKIKRIATGSTDLAAPMEHARGISQNVDCFVIMTDNETWAGNHHPVKELQAYRNWKGDPNVKMIVGAFTSTGFSIADPNDPLNLDIVGIDTNTPQLISDFARG